MLETAHGDKLDKRVLELQLSLLVDFAKHLGSYRAISGILPSHTSDKGFWEMTLNGHYLQALISWCMIFGGRGNEIHRENLVLEFGKGNTDTFKELLIPKANLTLDEWKNYHKELCDFRNMYVAHRVPSFQNNVPNLEPAFTVACVYFEWLKELLRPSENEPKSLVDYYQDVYNEAIQALKKI